MATERIQIEIRYLPINIWRHYGVVTKFGDYSGGIAQTDDEIEEKISFRICPKSTLSLLPSRYDMPIMRCFPIGSMKKQHDAILESFGTTKEINNSLTRLPSTTCSLLSSSPLLLKTLKISLLFFDLRNYSKSNFDLAAKLLFLNFF